METKETSTCDLCGKPGPTKFDTHDRWTHEGGCPVEETLEEFERRKALADINAMWRNT
jgi:hypothetical protein